MVIRCLRSALLALVLVIACSVSALAQAPRIVGGNNANVSDWPFIVSLQAYDRYNNKDYYEHFCGGSVIAPRIILTAAHCLAEGTAFDTYAFTGRRGYKDNNGQRIAASSVLTHPRYDYQTGHNDFALMLLSQAIAAPAIDLAEKVPAPGTMLHVAGWGNIADGRSPKDDLLREVAVPLVSDATCSKNYKYQFIASSMVCAGYAAGEKDACQGDSGGPLIERSSSGTVLQGIVSWGDGCALKNKPGVYSRVASRRDWIADASARMLAAPSPLPRDPVAFDLSGKYRGLPLKDYLAPQGECSGDNAWQPENKDMQQAALRCLLNNARNMASAASDKIEYDDLEPTSKITLGAQNLARILAGYNSKCPVSAEQPLKEVKQRPCGHLPTWPLRKAGYVETNWCFAASTIIHAGSRQGIRPILYTPYEVMQWLLYNKSTRKALFKKIQGRYTDIGIGIETRFSGDAETKYWVLYTATNTCPKRPSRAAEDDPFWRGPFETRSATAGR